MIINTDPHTKISIILIKKNFQRYAIAHSVAFYVYIGEMGSLLLWKFGLGSNTSFCGLLALRAAIDGWTDFDSHNWRTFKIRVLDHLELPKLAYET